MDTYEENGSLIELDDVLDALDALSEQEKGLAEEREELTERLAAHRPEALDRIENDVRRYLEVMGGDAADIIFKMPFLAATKSTRKAAKKTASRKRSGGWFHEPTGVTYKGGMLPAVLSSFMATAGVDLDDKEVKRAWIEDNCTRVE